MITTVIQKRNSGFQSEICDGWKLLDLARGWLRQGNAVVAVELLSAALESSQADQDKELRAKAFKETGRAHMMLSEWNRSEPYYIEAQRLFLELGDYRGCAECARNRANMLFQQGQYKESYRLCELALDWAASVNDHELRATILNTMAAVQSATGELQSALKTFQLCLGDFRTAGNVIRQGYVLLNIGLTEIDLGEYASAIGNLNEALSVALSQKDLHLVEICYQNIAKCYLAQQETFLARSVIDTARKILPGLGSTALEAELDILDAKVMRVMGDFDRAETLIADLHRRTVDNRLSALQADTQFEWGVLLGQTGRTSLAIAKLNAAVQQYRQIGADKGFRDAIKELDRLKLKADC